MVAMVTERGVVRVSGPDAASYLQGQVSQDVQGLATGASVWTLILQPTGKLVAWFRVHRIGDDEFLLDVDPDSLDPLMARLERFKLRTKVEFSVESGWQMLSLRGETLSGIDAAADGIVAAFDWPGFTGVDMLSASLEIPEGITLDPDRFEEARIRATVPRMGIDVDHDTIPAEGGAPLIDSTVSFTKGCYTGQELVARIDSRGGNVPRPLRTLVATEPLRRGADIVHDGASVGTITSAHGPVALARVMRKVDPGSRVSVDGVEATIQNPAPAAAG